MSAAQRGRELMQHVFGQTGLTVVDQPADGAPDFARQRFDCGL